MDGSHKGELKKHKLGDVLRVLTNLTTNSFELIDYRPQRLSIEETFYTPYFMELLSTIKPIESVDDYLDMSNCFSPQFS